MNFTKICFYICLICLTQVRAALGDTITWTNTAGGNWSDANSWSPNQIPEPDDDVQITANGNYTVTATDMDININSLTLGGGGGTNTLILSGVTSYHYFDFETAGVVNSNGVLKLNYFYLDAAPGLTVAGELDATNLIITQNSSLTVAAGGVLNATNADIWGPVTNYSIVNQSGQVEIENDGGNFRNGAIWNEGTWNIQNDGFGIYSGGNPSLEQFHNDGTLRKNGGAGAFDLEVYFENNGTLNVEDGIVNLDAAYSLASGILSFGVRGTDDFGQINFSNSAAALDGTLSFNLEDGYIPHVGDSFSPVTYANGASALFANLKLPASFGWQSDYGDTAFTLTVSNATPQLTLPSARGTVVAWGDNTYHQTNTPSGLIAAAISAGYWHNLAVTPAGKVVAWGLNDYGQTNVPAGLSNVVAVAAGHDHSLALKNNGVVVGWGDDSFNQIDVPSDLTNVRGNAIAIAAGAFHSAALRSDGTVECWGYDFYGETDPPDGLNNAIAIACGNAFSIALRADGTVVAWGDDYYGQTDVPAGLSNVVAISAGGFHALALKSDGTIAGWGADNTNSDTINYGQSTPPQDLTSAIAVADGYLHSLAVRNNGTIEQWGDTSLGQANGTTNIHNLNRILAVSGGYAHSLALKDATILITNQPPDVLTNVGANVRFTVAVNGATPISYRWYSTAGVSNKLIASTLNSSLFINTLSLNNVLTNDIYMVTVSNAACVVTGRLANLTLYPGQIPVILTNPVSKTVNIGSNATFSVVAAGNAPLAFQWYLAQTNFNGFTNVLVTNIIANATSSFITISNAQATDAGRYFVVVTNNYGMAVSTNATLTVQLRPVIASDLLDVTTNVGATVKFSVGVTGTAPMNYRWFSTAGVSNKLILSSLNSSALTNTLTLNNVLTNDIYMVTVSNAVGVVTSRLASLMLYAPQSPVIATNPVSKTIIAGSNATFTVTVVGTDPLAYQWYLIQTNFNGVTNVLVTNLIVNATDTFITISNAQATDAGRYFVVVTNFYGTAVSTNATLTVVVAPAITNQPMDVNTNVGANVKFTVGVTGTTPINYRWFLTAGVSNRLIASTSGTAALTNVLTLNFITTNNAGAYFVTVSNAAGVVTSSVAHLTAFISQAFTPAQLYLLSHFGGGDALMIAVEAGKNYRIQSSTDLQNWMDVTNFLSTSTLIDYTNSLTTNSPFMFYRVASP